MTPLVSVIIVAYLSADDLAELLPMLADPRLEVIVLDNASPDDGLAVATRHPWCVSVPMQHNSGWTAASNEGARRAVAPVLAFVNPDVRTTADQLLALAERLGPGVASVSPLMAGTDGSPRPFAFRFPTPLMGLFVFFNAGRRLDRILGSPFMRRRTYAGQPADIEVDHVGAACMVVDAGLFASSGGFDERMWLFFSDMDWALRMRRRGLLNAVAHDIHVVHEGGGSVSHLSQADLSLAFQRDYVRYAKKHYSAWGSLITRAGAVLLAGLLPGLAALVRGRPRETQACLKQAAEVLR